MIIYRYCCCGPTKALDRGSSVQPGRSHVLNLELECILVDNSTILTNTVPSFKLACADHIYNLQNIVICHCSMVPACHPQGTTTLLPVLACTLGHAHTQCQLINAADCLSPIYRTHQEHSPLLFHFQVVSISGDFYGNNFKRQKVAKPPALI